MYSLEPPHRGQFLTSTHNLCFLSRNKKKITYTPVKPQFYYIKSGVLRGVKNYIGMFFVMLWLSVKEFIVITFNVDASWTLYHTCPKTSKKVYFGTRLVCLKTA